MDLKRWRLEIWFPTEVCLALSLSRSVSLSLSMNVVIEKVFSFIVDSYVYFVVDFIKIVSLVPQK